MSAKRMPMWASEKVSPFDRSHQSWMLARLRRVKQALVVDVWERAFRMALLKRTEKLPVAKIQKIT